MISVVVVTAAIAATGGGAIGALVRQPEINRLKSQIVVLQKEVENSHNTINNMLRDFELLELKYHISKNKDIIFDTSNTDYCKALLAYGFYEYLDKKCDFLLENNSLTEKEAAFVDAFTIYLSDQPIDEVQERDINEYIIEYLDSKYSDLVHKGEHPNFDELIDKINLSISVKEEKDDNSTGIPPSEIACLTISEHQMRIMYSLEYNKVSHDRDCTKDEIDKKRKTDWLIKWSSEILKGIGKEGIKGYFYNENETFSALKEELDRDTAQNWYYIVMMEQYLFTPYCLFDSANKKSSPWKGLKYEDDYVKVICEKQSIVDESFFKRIKKTYHSAVSYLDEKAVKAMVAIGSVIVASVATFGLSYAFAPAIAVGLVGSSFASLSGQALINASLAYLGGGALAVGGSGMAGGVALITGGGAIIGAASSGAAAIGTALLSASPEITLRECAKLITCFEEIILKQPQLRNDARMIYAKVLEKCNEIDMRIEELEAHLLTLKKNDNTKLKEVKGLIASFKKSKKYFEKTRDKIQLLLLG